jgi:hypothetical protein
MREILFRGKDIAGNWHYGVPLVFTEDYVCITAPHTYNKSVIPETVGQYTGLNVGNEKLFEGDIVEWHEDYDDIWGYPQTTVGRSVVVWDENNFCCAFNTDGYLQAFNDWNWNSSFIIGNIHDNPELLKGEQNNDRA